MKKLFLSFLLIPSILFSQPNTGKGIYFEQGLSWEQVKQKAKEENKFIFADVYATWCGPCKRMDRDVYPTDSVGDYVNKEFISIKVQIDSSQKDNEQLRKWYADASYIKELYQIHDFPTYLFFSPDGTIVHRGVGSKTISEFVHLVKDSKDESKQYYTLLRNYENGEKDFEKMPYMVRTASNLGNRNAAYRIANDYIENYLLKQDKEVIYTKANLEFIASFIDNSKGAAFKLLYEQPTKIDKLVKKRNYAESVIEYVITKELIDPSLTKAINANGPEPNWTDLTSLIRKTYNDRYAKKTVLDGQLRWYRMKENWPKLIKYNIRKIENYGIDTSEFGTASTNNMIYGVILLHCNDEKILNKAIAWQKKIIEAHPDFDYLDTYANLLYKVGRRAEAIQWEGKALQVEEETALKYKMKPNPVFQQTIEKMKAGLPTWIENDEKKD